MTRATFPLVLLAAIVGDATAAAQQPICSANASALERLICRDTTLAGGGTPQGGPPATPLPPPIPQPPTTTGTGTLYVSLTNIYRADLRVLGLVGVRRSGVDQASGTLTWNEANGTYEGVLDADASGSFLGPAIIGQGESCVDRSAGEQRIYAVGFVEAWQGQPAYLAPWRDSVAIGRFGPQAIVFYFFPDSPPVFTVSSNPRCQDPIRFEGYGPGANENPAPYPWLPQRRQAALFLPFNDTRWTTQNGLIVRMPPENDWVNYWDLTQVLPAEGVVSRWNITVVHGGH